MLASDFSVRALADRQAVTDMTVRMLRHTDRREWDQFRDIFADQVTLACASLNDNERVVLSTGQGVQV